MTEPAEAVDQPSQGSALRARLEKAQAREKAWRTAFATRIVADHPGVTLDDLDEVDDPSQLSGAAAEIAANRMAHREQTLRAALADRGVEVGDDLDAVFSRLNAPAPVIESPQSRVASLGRIGAPPSRAHHEADGFGEARILAAEKQQSRRT